MAETHRACEHRTGEHPAGADPPTVRSWPGEALTIPPVAIATGCDLVIPRPPALRLPVGLPRPEVRSLELLPPRPSVQSHFFARPHAVAAASLAKPPVSAVPRAAAAGEMLPGEPGEPGAATGRGPARRTRIAPPQDVVKLSERFFYLLQPDLETMLRGGKLGFPRAPFPFQLAGMAFLLPRHSAVLADEMGLGKSMQAISSIRLLVRSGEARRVLVVCPKGLVSNWARELADWAPELLVAVIDGDPARRRWQWSLPDVPVKLANYEVLVRDRDLVAELGLAFDLVVLDEAQRIKNRSSQTNQAIVGLRRRRSWALTGTPVENSADDLVGIFEFVEPGQINDRMTPKAMAAAVTERTRPDYDPKKVAQGISSLMDASRFLQKIETTTAPKN